MARRYTAVFLFSILKANISNEWYAKDTSKKIRAVMKSKGEAGEHLCTNPPYGYMKAPDNKKQWIVDEEAAGVVKRIFALCLDGYGPSQIARILKEDSVITPTIHFQQMGRATRNTPPDNPYNWTGDTIADILERPEYQGHTVTSRLINSPTRARKPVTIQRKNVSYLRTPTKRLLTLTHGRGCRNYGRTNAARRGQEKQICSPALCAVLTAAKNCITAQAKTLKRRQLTQAERRIEELDRLFKRIYEDNANGKLSDRRFQMLSDDYEQEQEELREKLLRLNEEINEQEEQSENISNTVL